ncbi:MAG: response regulator [Bacteroidales bacterium]|nr:response regulator [Bacteroidales bacterium]
MIGIINDIVDIAKIEAGIIPIEKSVCSLQTVFKEIYEIFWGEMQKNGITDIEFSYTSPSDLAQEIHTDATRLKQILTNLISNAFKFTEKGKIEFGAEVTDTFITFFVKDTGLGIPEDKFEIIFDRFRQVDDSHTREFGGTGIGLTIAKSLVERLGGTIWLESNLYEGSQFFFKLPLQPFTSGELKSRETPIPVKPVSKENWSTKTFLVVEDVESNYLYIETLLKQTKATVLWADNGEKAIEFVKTNPEIDLVLMDIQLPDKTFGKMTLSG